MDHRFLQEGYDLQLSHLMEQAAKVIQAGAKIQRWGRDSTNPILPVGAPHYGETNEKWLRRKIGDFILAAGRLANTAQAETVARKSVAEFIEDDDEDHDYTVTPENVNGSHRMFGLSESLTKEDIVAVLGFEPNIKDDPEKVKNSWGFRVHLKNGDHDRGAIWDYKGSRWSAFGNKEIFELLFPGKV